MGMTMGGIHTSPQAPTVKWWVGGPGVQGSTIWGLPKITDPINPKYKQQGSLIVRTPVRYP